MSLSNIFQISPLPVWVTETLSNTGNPAPYNSTEIIWCKGQPGQVYCVASGDYRNPADFAGKEGYYIRFCSGSLGICNETNWQLFGLTFQNNENCQLLPDVSAALEVLLTDTVARLEKEQAAELPWAVESVAALLQLLCIALHRHREQTLKTPRDQRGYFFARRFFQLLEGNYRQVKSVSEYAALLQLSPTRLNMVIKRVTGYSPKYHISKRLIIEAQRSYRQHSQSMKEIAYDLGFMDNAHFSKFFKRTSGVTFMHFRDTVSSQVHPGIKRP